MSTPRAEKCMKRNATTVSYHTLRTRPNPPGFFSPFFCQNKVTPCYFVLHLTIYVPQSTHPLMPVSWAAMGLWHSRIQITISIRQDASFLSGDGPMGSGVGEGFKSPFQSASRNKVTSRYVVLHICWIRYKFYAFWWCQVVDGGIPRITVKTLFGFCATVSGLKWCQVVYGGIPRITVKTLFHFYSVFSE